MENQPPYRHTADESEVTLADIILTIQAYFRYLFRKWYWVLVTIIAGVLIAFAVVKYQTINYIADITFVANQEGQRGGNSILASTLASFGFSGESGSGESGQYSKIIALSQSRRIQFAALLDTAILDDQSDLMVNHLSRIYDLKNKWEVDQPIHFINQSPDSMDLTHTRYLKRVYNMITKGNHPLFTISFDNSSQMINMTSETINPDLSIALVHSLYTNLNAFYVIQSTAKGKETVNTLTHRRDSLENELQKQQARLASARDRSAGMTYRAQQTNRQDLEVDAGITRTMYMEVVKNLEMSRFNLENIRPVFTIIDSPLKPLPTDRKNMLRFMAIFGLVGAVIAVMVLILRKMYVDIMRNVEKD